MGKVQELYNARILPLVPAERLQLARLILDDLASAPTEDAIDIRDEWSDDDLTDAAAFAANSANHAATDVKATP